MNKDELVNDPDKDVGNAIDEIKKKENLRKVSDAQVKKNEGKSVLEQTIHTENPISIISGEEQKVAVKMLTGYGWVTASGVKFTKEKPYQLMEAGEASLLLQNSDGRFEIATKEQVKEHFGVS